MSDDKKHPIYDTEKSWKEAHKIERLIRLKVQDIQKNMAAVVVETDQVIELCKQLYIKLPKTDGTLFGISPLAPNQIVEHLIDYIFRAESKDKNFSRRIKQLSILDFSKKFDFENGVNNALAWAFKHEKVDLDKIV